MNIKLDGSKYEILADEKDGFKFVNFRALRHGEKWRDLTGDNLIYWLCQEIEALKKHDRQI
jgi:hypothetical protein